MKRALKSVAALAVSGALLFCCGTASAYAGEPYQVYNYDRWGEAIPSQAGYIADRAVSGADLGGLNQVLRQMLESLGFFL